MKGLELSKSYYEEYGKPMLEEDFPELLPYLCCGLAGSGSECFGYDDDISRDHDFEPGFCIFLPGEEIVDRKRTFALERAYSKLPREFCGIKRSAMQPVGGSRHGVIRTEEFFFDRTGSRNGELTPSQWLSLPEEYLAEATNGEIYFDNFGEVSKIREALSYFPEDIRKKKLAGQLLLMAQAGQYNYPRLLSHGEKAAAQMAVFEFVKSLTSVIFLLNEKYMPYYKWAFRALRELPRLSLHAELMEYLITTDNDGDLSGDKFDVIESMAYDVIEELHLQNLTEASCGDLEKHAYSVNDGIGNSEIRNMHILAGV